MKTNVVRAEVQRLLRQVPFRPFLMALDNGEHITIGHPENIAFDPSDNGSQAGSEDFYVISGSVRLFSTFEAVSSVAVLDQGRIS